jgi:hypothetical protein
MVAIQTHAEQTRCFVFYFFSCIDYLEKECESCPYTFGKVLILCYHLPLYKFLECIGIQIEHPHIPSTQFCEQPSISDMQATK